MTATNHTEHYGLSQYTEDDHPTYTGDYNGDMSKIDAAIFAATQSGGGMTTVEHTADLTGDGSADNPLGVADAIARTEDIPSLDGYATTESVTQAIASAIADRLTTVTHDATLTGDGTSSTPLGIVNGLNFSSFNAELTWDRPLSEIKTPGLYRIVGNPQNSPDSDLPDFIKNRTQATAVLLVYKNATAFIRIIYVEYAATSSGGELTLRCFGKTYTPSASSEWFDLNPGGSGGLSAVSHDATLTGDGTSSNPLGMIEGNFINAISKSGDEADANKLTANRIYKIGRNWGNMPPDATIVSGSLLDASYGNARVQCILAYTDGKGTSIFIRQGWASLANAKWDRLVKESEYNSLVNRVAKLESRVAALTAAATPSATGLTSEQLDS